MFLIIESFSDVSKMIKEYAQKYLDAIYTGIKICNLLLMELFAVLSFPVLKLVYKTVQTSNKR